MRGQKKKSGLATLDETLSPRQTEMLNELEREIAEGGSESLDRVRGILSLVGDKWSALILLVLASGRLRHASLLRALHMVGNGRPISQRILTLKLRAFERNGLIDRRASDDTPPKVDYALTPKGRELAAHTRMLIDWIKACSSKDGNSSD